MISGFAVPSSASGYCKSDLVFPTEGDSNFRIPMLVAGENGALFAFCNDRRQSVSDNAEIQWLAYSKAADGVNFSEWEYLLKKDGWTYIIGSAVYDRLNNNLMLVYYATVVTDAAKAEYNAMTAEERENNPVGSAIIETSDGGATWTRRSVKMPTTYEKPYSTASVHGAGTGIQLKYGENAGRLVFAAKAGNSTIASVEKMSERMVGTLIYSDDFGKTWKSSLNCMPFGTDETSICELSDGTLYITSRMISNTCGRYVAYSYDGGRSIKDKRIDESLEVQCQYGIRGAVTNIPDYDGKGNSLTLFSSLNSPVAARRNLAVWLSYDGGKTWADKVIIDSGLCSYSEIVYNPSTRLISIMYERGDVSCYSSGIQITSFDIEWLLSQKQPNVSLRNTPSLSESIAAELVEDGLILNLGANPDKYKTADVGLTGYALNGRSAFAFDGIHGISVQNLSELTGNITFFAVYKSNSDVPEDSAVLFQSTHAQGIRTYMSETSAAVTTYVGNGIYNAAEAQKFTDTDWHIMAVTWNGDSADTALLTQFLDGNTDLKYEIGKSVIRTSNNSGVVRIGYGFDGLIADVLVYNRALSDEEVAKTGLYLADMYGLSWQVTESEPFEDEEPNGTAPAVPTDGDTAAEESVTDGESDESKRGCGSTVACAGMAAVAVTSAAVVSFGNSNKKKNRRKK